MNNLKTNLQWASQEASITVLPTLAPLKNGMVDMITFVKAHYTHARPIYLDDCVRDNWNL